MVFYKTSVDVVFDLICFYSIQTANSVYELLLYNQDDDN